MTATAVQQAVSLLRARLSEAHAEVTRLTVEINEIEAALQVLGVQGARASENEVLAVRENPPVDLGALSIASAALAVMEAEVGPWSPRLVRDRLVSLAPDMQGTRTDEEFITAIRTAFYNMRKRGTIVTDEHNRSTATKWLPASGSQKSLGPAVDTAGPIQTIEGANPDQRGHFVGANGTSLPVR